MDEKLKKALSVATAGYLTIQMVLHPQDEDPSTHPETYNKPNDNKTWSVVVSGTSYRDELPDYITDLGPNSDRAGEHIFRVTLPSSGHVE